MAESAMLLLLACHPPDDRLRGPLDTAKDDTATAIDGIVDTHTGETADTDWVDTGDSSDTADTSDTGTSPPPRGVLVLAGGGSEGALDSPNAWSWDLYAALIENGDVTGDGAVTVAVLSVWDEDAWMPTYLEWLGATDAFNVRAADPKEADAVAARVAGCDAVFIKGGDQGAYYDAWNGTALEDAIVGVYAAGGGIGGTSAGAMSQSEWAIAGSADYDSFQVLADARTVALDDVSDGGSGIHGDFLGLLPGTLVDTHFTTRSRLGRLVGALARVVDDEGATPVGIGVDEQTGLVVRGDLAEVMGYGTVTFLVTEAADSPMRVDGSPLHWTGLRLERLTSGGTWDLGTDTALDAGPFAEGVPTLVEPGPAPVGWEVEGDQVEEEARFAWTVDRWPDPYLLVEGTEPFLPCAIGILDAHQANRRGPNEDSIFRAAYDVPGATGWLVGEGSAVVRDDDGLLSVVADDDSAERPMAAIVLDTRGATWRSLSASPSPNDTGDGSLHAAGLDGIELSVVWSEVSGNRWDPDSGQVR